MIFDRELTMNFQENMKGTILWSQWTTKSPTSTTLIILLLNGLLHMAAAYVDYDCYDSWCKGTGIYYGEIISCDQESNFCEHILGKPVCKSGHSGSGVFCPCRDFSCVDDPLSARVVCTCPGDEDDNPIMGNLMIGLVTTIVLVSIIVCLICSLKSICLYFKPSTAESDDPNSIVIANPENREIGFVESFDLPPSYFEVQTRSGYAGFVPPSYSEIEEMENAIRENYSHEENCTDLNQLEQQ